LLAGLPDALPNGAPGFRMAGIPTCRLILLSFLVLWAGVAGARAVDSGSFTGHYEPAVAGADLVFALDISQTGSQADVSFSASMTDGSGAAPEAEGKGRVDAAGVLKFTFKDSFDNEGTGTLVQRPDGYHLHLDVSKVVDPRPTRFYGDIVLKKLSDKPASS
jgi:hypothetical protein